MKLTVSWNGKFLVCDLINYVLFSFDLFLVSVACFLMSDLKKDSISVEV